MNRLDPLLGGAPQGRYYREKDGDGVLSKHVNEASGPAWGSGRRPKEVSITP